MSVFVLLATAGGAGASPPPAADGISPVARTDAYLYIDQGEEAVFNGSNSTDNVGIVNWTWFFFYDERDYTLYGEKTSFEFDESGYYSVQLTVRDAAGNQNSTVFILTVYGEEVQPIHTEGPLYRWVWAIAGGTFILFLIFLLGFVHRAKPERPPGEDPYHQHW